jgi:hypothetical protein
MGCILASAKGMPDQGDESSDHAVSVAPSPSAPLILFPESLWNRS